MNNKTKKRLLEFLYSTEAIQVAPEGEMFLLTSGLLAPYYINTHYLCGGQSESVKMLSLIDSYKSEPKKIVSDVAPKIMELVNSDKIYREVVEMMILSAKEYLIENQIDFISGGERRDWFFSIPLASMLNLPHLFLYNDGLVLDNAGNNFVNTKTFNTIHVADLLTVGSSYTNKWIPALKKLGVDVSLSINCVDRVQGGVTNLKESGVKETISLCDIDQEFFMESHHMGFISDWQYQQMSEYYKTQYDSMREFLIKNPNFISKSLESDNKTKARMLITLNNDLYNLGSDCIEKYLRAKN